MPGVRTAPVSGAKPMWSCQATNKRIRALQALLALVLAGCSSQDPGVSDQDHQADDHGLDLVEPADVDSSGGVEDSVLADDSTNGDVHTADSNAPDDPLDSFFSLDTIHKVTITVDEAALSSLVLSPKLYVSANLTIDDSVYAKVGIRLKGNMGSFVPIDEASAVGRRPAKSAFIIDFNRFIKGQDHLGMKKLTVNNMVQDPSGMDQFLGYALFRAAGVPASRSGFAQVEFNGIYKGLYALVETPDNKSFLERWFVSSDGNLYEGNGSDFTVDSYMSFDQDRGDDVSKDDLRMLAEALDSAPSDDSAYEYLSSLFNLEDYVLFTAIEVFLGHWDGYAWNTNNFLFYHDVDGAAFNFIPWGIDQLFDEANIMGPYHGLMKDLGPSWTTPDRGFDSLLNGGRFQHVCFASFACRSAWGAQFQKIADIAESMDLAGLAAATRALIEPPMLEEARLFSSVEAVKQAMDQVQQFIDDRPSTLAQWLPCLDGDMVDNDGDSFDGCTIDCDDFDKNIHPGANELCNLEDDDCSGLIDDAETCPQCYDLSLASGDYSLCFRPAGWMQARQTCIDRGQDLASIHDADTNLILPWNLMEKTGYSESWIGLNDIKIEGDWGWSDGSAVDFDYRLVPIGPEWDVYLDCAAYTLILGWLPQPCWDERPFICGSP